MRQLRPEYYSDTTSRAHYELTGDELEYRLSTITARNEHHAFEVFCRKLCERAVCPNLRPATGPEGGGDGKADSETFPVAEEISTLWYVGSPQAGQQRWAFAFSAKEGWRQKVRDDVIALVGTKRPYVQIICVTSQFARSKDRAEVQDEMREAHKVEVTIHDRAWIVEQIIENDWRDLAVNYLGAGRVSKAARLGPTDYVREQQLEEIENLIADPDHFAGRKMQLATEALVAAKMSRGLERPRVETDGRFARAIRLANSHGTHRQHLEALYESIWTAFWWYDDFDLVIDQYTELERLGIDSPYALNLEFLANIAQLFFNMVIHGLRNAEQIQLDDRIPRLFGRLEAVAANGALPNNALEARVSLLMLQGAQAKMQGDDEAFEALWPKFSEVIDQARGLGEFSGGRLSELISVMGAVAGGDAGYSALVDKTAAFVAERTGEANGAVMLLKRSRQLDEPMEIIRILGRAARQLTKKEYRQEQREALMRLAQAYQEIGLIWAARANVLVAIATMFIEAEEDAEPPTAQVVPALLYLVAIDLELRYFPEALEVMILARGAAQLLDNESKPRFVQELDRLDHVLACQFTCLQRANLQAMARLPDVVAQLEMPTSRYALLYVLGYEELLLEEGWAPKDYTPERIAQVFSLMAAQPCAPGEVDVLNCQGEQQTLLTRVLGIRLEVLHGGSDLEAQVAESVVGTVEALFATALQAKVCAHTEAFAVTISLSSTVANPEYELDEFAYAAKLQWPAGLALTEVSRQKDIQPKLLGLAYTILAVTCRSAGKLTEAIGELEKNESFLDRFAMIVFSANSRERMLKSGVARIERFDHLVTRDYPPKERRLTITPAELGPDPESADDDAAISDHREVRVHSVIDEHRWAKARWRGASLSLLGPGEPPILGLIFEDEDAARGIFLRWQERFGTDQGKDIYVAIVRNVAPTEPHHYTILVTSNLPGDGKAAGVVSRIMRVPAKTAVHLDAFAQAYEEAQECFLAPVVLRDGQPHLLMDVAILKRGLSIRNADDVGDHDVEFMAVGADRRRGATS
ncbi:tetratricopeptide repeat protein [Caenimonas sedimenti]|uniref:Tetratricopeptide repeat protein n=2 Tax=Caenimonas sedimenti TaxID=2596921 RepID=A0A562ZT61_9BURK|nr:tetratricopeptide repeat protein [Caenimonas sedimenti]